jgi:hypothetical protein
MAKKHLDVIMDESRLYGVPESLKPRDTEPERLELFIDEDEFKERLEKMQSAVQRVFSDPEAAAAFQKDPRAFMTEAGLPEAGVHWDSLEVSYGRALGDEQLRELARAGDAAGFVNRLQVIGVLPPTMAVVFRRAEAMGFGLIPFVSLATFVVIILWVGAAIGAVVSLGAYIAAAVWTLALVATEAVLVTSPIAITNLLVDTFVTGPGGDNPDENEDAGSPLYRMKLASPNVIRLIGRVLNVELLARLASYLRDQGFGQEVTEELVKKAIVSVWKKATTGEIDDPEREQLYIEMLKALSNEKLLEREPELSGLTRYAMLGSGFAGPAYELMMQMRESARMISLTFNPAELLINQKVLIVPTGGLYGLDKSPTFKARLEEYVRLGGTVIVMGQQHGYDFNALPGGVAAYGWAEDQSCHARSVVITRSHPVFAGQDTVEMDVSIDGFFTSWPEGADILLRRRVNGQPALLTYRYGAGRVVVTSAYADWGISHNQLSRDERLLMRDLFTWARVADIEVPEFDPDKAPFKITFSVKNRAQVAAGRAVITTIDPEKNIKRAHFSVDVAIPSGQAREITLETSELTALGYWALDVELLDENGNVIDIQYEVAFLLVNNFDDTIEGVGYKAEPLSFSAICDDENMLAGAVAQLKVLVWNYSDQMRTLTLKTDINHKNPTTQIVKVAPGRRSEVALEHGPLDVGRYRLWAYFYDENGKLLGSTTKGFFGYKPSAKVKISTDKSSYKPGEVIQMRVEYANGIGAAFDADFRVAITSPSGATMFDEAFTAALLPQIPGDKAFTFPLPVSVSYGAFKVSVEVDRSGERISYHETFFTPVLQGTIAGRVLHAVTGEPIEGAKVSLDSNALVAADAATGSFSFVTTTGGHWVSAEAPGFVKSRAYTVVTPERTASVESIYLSPQSGHIKGLVMDLVTNQPIEGAKFTPQDRPAQTLSGTGAFDSDQPRGERSVTAEATGYIGKPSMSVQVYPSRATQIASLFLTPTTGKVDVTVRRADTGEPLNGAEVYSPGEPSTVTDQEGRFSRAYPPGQREIRARAPGYAEASVTVHITSGRAVKVDDVYLLPSFGEATGVIYDAASEQPIVGAIVRSGSLPAVITDADGRYRIRLRAQIQSLDVQAPGFTGKTIKIAVVAGKTLEGMDLGLAAMVGRALGAVIDAGSGQPIAGAIVRDAGGTSVTTDADGRFSIVTPVQTTTIYADAAGFQTAQASVDVYPSRGTSIDTFFLLALRGQVTGRLVDAATGAPLAGARVWVDYGDDVRTSADGSFSLKGNAGFVALHAEAEGYQALSKVQIDVFPDRATVVGDLPLASALGAVSGRTRDAAGGGIAGVKITADSLPQEAKADALVVAGTVKDRITGAPIAGARVLAETDSVRFTGQDGGFKARVSPGARRIQMEAPGYSKIDFYSRVDWGYASMLSELQMAPLRGKVKGVVSSAVTGDRLADVKVWSTSLQAEWTLTDQDGQFTLSLPDGAHTLTASTGGYASYSGSRIQILSTIETNAPEIRLTPSYGVIEGVVRDALTGAPINNSIVSFDNLKSVSTDADGRFRCSVAPGARSVTAIAEGYSGQVQAYIYVQAGATTAVSALTLSPLSTELRGAVRNLIDGSLVAGARVWVDSDNDSAVITDAGGKFSITTSPGGHRLQAEAMGYAGTAVADVVGTAGRATDAALLFLLPVGATAPQGAGGPFEGKLLDALTGAPIAGAMVYYGNASYTLGAISQANAAYGVGSSLPDTHAVTGDLLWTDYTLELESRASTSYGFGVLLRYTDEQNYYRFLWLNDVASGGPLRRLERVVGGQRTVMAEDRVPYLLNAWLAVEASVIGDTITIRADGRDVFSVQDASLSAGRIGLACYRQPGQLFRAVRVTGAGASAGQPLFVEPFSGSMAAWAITDPAGTPQPSKWSSAAPTSTRTAADGTFNFASVPAGAQSIFLDAESGYIAHRSDYQLCNFTPRPGQSASLTFYPVPQSGAFTGSLRDVVTGAPIVDARVWVANEASSAVTDSQGAFTLSLPAVSSTNTPYTREVFFRSSAYGSADISLYRGSLTPGSEASFSTSLRPLVGDVNLKAISPSGEPISGVEIYYGDPTLRWGGFRLSRAEGSREGNAALEGPTILTGDPSWGDAEVSFEARCDSTSGWGAVLRYQNPGSMLRLFYLVPASGAGGAWLVLTRRDGLNETILAEKRQTHDIYRWYSVKFAAAGSQLTVDVDGQRVFDVQDTSAITTGRAGLTLWGQTGTTLRNVSVTAPDGSKVTAGDTALWSEAPGFGYVGGNIGSVTGAVTGDPGGDVTSIRSGSKFSYHFPVPDGDYRVELTMVETTHKLAGKRRFRVYANQKLLEPDLDLYATAGYNVAVKRTYAATSTRGSLHLVFSAIVDNASVAYIRIWRGAQPAVGEAPLYVVRAGAAADRPLYQATNIFGLVGGAYAQTGGAVVAPDGTPPEVAALLSTYREGASTYRLHPGPGSHAIDLYFVDHTTSLPGQRVMDVLVNGAPVIQSLDVVRLVGKGAVYKTTVTASSSGEPIEISLRSVYGSATISVIALGQPGTDGIVIGCGSPSEPAWSDARGASLARLPIARKITGQDGVAAWSALPVGDYGFGAEKAGLALPSGAERLLDAPVVGGREVSYAGVLRRAAGTVTGRVVNGATGQGIAAADVWYGNNLGAVKTGQDGSFELTNLPSGWQWISVSATGYKGLGNQAQQLQVWSEPGAMLSATLTLVPTTFTPALPYNLSASQVVTAADGTFQMALPVGRRTVSLDAPQIGGKRDLSADIYPASTLKIDLKVGGAGAPVLEGIVTTNTAAHPSGLVEINYGDPLYARGALHQVSNIYTAAAGVNYPYRGTHAAFGDAAWTDYRLSFQARCYDNDAWGALFRYTSDSNYYRFFWVLDADSGGPLRRLERVQNGTFTTLAEDRAAFPTNQWMDIDIEATLDTLSVRVDGHEVFRVQDATFSAGRVGFYCWGQERQLYRAISVMSAAGEPLFTETSKTGLASYTTSDPPSALSGPSKWEMLAPTGAALGADGSFRLEGLAAANQYIYAFGSGIRTTASDGSLLYLPARTGDLWRIEAQVAPAYGDFSLRLLDATTGSPVQGAQAWAYSDPRQIVSPDADGRIKLRLPTAVGTSPPAEEWLYVTAPGYSVRGPSSHQAILLLPTRPGDEPVVGLTPSSGTLSGVVYSSVDNAPESGVNVFWGDGDLALGSARIAGARYSGDAVAGTLRGPALLTSASFADSAISAEIKAKGACGVALLLRRQDIATGYRAVLVYDPDRSTTAVDSGTISGSSISFTRKTTGSPQVFTGTLDGGALQGTFTASGKSYKFIARRRLVTANDAISGEWVINASGTWLRAVLTALSPTTFSGQCHDTYFGGSSVRLERWSGGDLSVLAEVSLSPYTLTDWNTFKLYAAGTTLRLRVGQLTLVEVTDSAPLPAGRAGVEAFGATDTLFRSIHVDDAGGDVLFADNFAGGLSAWTGGEGWGYVGGYSSRVDWLIDGDDQALVTHSRYGSDVLYLFGLPPGSYQVELAFCEATHSAVNTRVFDVLINEEIVESALDIFAVAGAKKALLRRYTASPGPSGLTVRVKARKDYALINHIRVWSASADPADPAASAPLIAVRAGAEGDPALFHSTIDWGIQGGFTYQAAAGTAIPGVTAAEAVKLLNQRLGTFKYLFKLPPGQYDAELSFVELQSPKQANSRVFDVYANGALALQKIDIAMRVGNGLLRQRVQAVTVGADGLLTLDFNPRTGQPAVNLIRIFQQGSQAPLVEADAGSGSDRDWTSGSALDSVWVARGPQGVITGSDGRFVFQGVPLGSQYVSLRGADIATLQTSGVSATLTILAGLEHKLALFTKPSVAILSGEVVDIVTGQPIEGAEVWYDPAARWKTDEAGLFSIPNFPLTLRDLYARAEGYVSPGADSYVMSALVGAGQNAYFRVFLTPAYAEVQGRLLDAVTGEPVENGRVWLGTQRRGVITGADGTFEVKDFPAMQSVPMYAARDGYVAPGTSGHMITLQSIAGRRARFTAYLKPTHGIVQGKVLDLVTEEPIVGALVYVDNGEISGTTDAVGAFRLRVPGGDHRLYVESVRYISEVGHNPSSRLTVVSGKMIELTLYLKSISGVIEGQVVDSITEAPITGALVYADEGFANVLTGPDGRYSLPQSNKEHTIYIKAVDYAADREDGWMASATVEPDRAVRFKHLLRPSLQLLSFAFVELPAPFELYAGQEHTVVCRVRNTGKREGGVTMRLIIPGFVEQENTEWVTPGAEADVAFTFKMPEDALEADHQEVYFEIVDGPRQRMLVPIRGARITVQATLDKLTYSAGDTAVLHLHIDKVAGGPISVFTRAQIGDQSHVSTAKELSDSIDVEHTLMIGEAHGKMAFGVYMSTGRALYLNAFYVPREGDIVTFVASKQAYDQGEAVSLEATLKAGGHTLFDGAGPVTGELKLMRADDGAEVIGAFQVPIASDGPTSIGLTLPSIMRQGTCLLVWTLKAGDKSASGSEPIDVRGYKARVIEFLTDKHEYLHNDSVAVDGSFDLSHAGTYRLTVSVRTVIGEEISATTKDMTLPAGRSAFHLDLALDTPHAGSHVLLYGLSAVMGESVLPLLAAMQGFDVEGPVILALNTDRRRYHAGNTVNVQLLSRGDFKAALKLFWDTGEVALESTVILGKLTTLSYSITAPVGAHYLNAELTADTKSTMKAFAEVLP